MNLDAIREIIKVDSIIDINHLDDESLRIPILHQKYYDMYINERRIFGEMEFEYKKLLRFKFEYYLGKSPDHVYQEKPFSLRVQKQDLDLYVESDEDIQNQKRKVDLQKMKCDLLQEMIKTINNRGFLIRDAIEFLKFKMGR